MTSDLRRELVVLLAEDNPAEQHLARRALERGGFPCDLHVVSDGVLALDYLRREGSYADPKEAPFPDLMLLDLNMPRLNGFAVLQAVRQDSALVRLPVIVLTTSSREQDIIASYEYGCTSFITKPYDMSDFVALAEQLKKYWIETVQLPPSGDA